MKYTKKIDLSIQPTDDGIMLLDKSTGSIHHLNPVASLIWDDIEQPTTEIISKVTNLYDVNERTAKEDIVSIIQQLIEHGLIAQDEQ